MKNKYAIKCRPNSESFHRFLVTQQLNMSSCVFFLFVCHIRLDQTKVKQIKLDQTICLAQTKLNQNELDQTIQIYKTKIYQTQQK